MTIRIIAAVVAFFALQTGSIEINKAVASNELDQESRIINEQARRAKELPGTVVVRIQQQTGQASVLELTDRLEASADSARLVADLAGFKSIPASGVQSPPAGELDRNSSASSWYAFYNSGYFYAPTYYYWGYTFAYRSYYSYNWSGYAYYWYGWW
jgi:hypothetical protein